MSILWALNTKNKRFGPVPEWLQGTSFMARPREKDPQSISLGIKINSVMLQGIERRCNQLGLTKSTYIKGLIEKDLAADMSPDEILKIVQRVVREERGKTWGSHD